MGEVAPLGHGLAAYAPDPDEMGPKPYANDDSPQSELANASRKVGHGAQRPKGMGILYVVPVKYTRISSSFGTRFHPILKKRMPHNGIDLVAPFGAPVHAIQEGIIDFTGFHAKAGRLVRILHPDGKISSYAHLSDIETGIKKGSSVKQGQKIGSVGSSGLATGPNLHFAIRDGKNGPYLDPEPLLHAAIHAPSHLDMQGALTAGRRAAALAAEERLRSK